MKKTLSLLVLLIILIGSCYSLADDTSINRHTNKALICADVVGGSSSKYSLARNLLVSGQAVVNFNDNVFSGLYEEIFSHYTVSIEANDTGSYRMRIYINFSGGLRLEIKTVEDVKPFSSGYDSTQMVPEFVDALQGNYDDEQVADCWIEEV